MQVVDEEHFLRAEAQRDNNPAFFSHVGKKHLYASTAHTCSLDSLNKKKLPLNSVLPARIQVETSSCIHNNTANKLLSFILTEK